jgi:hypothetical protein
MIILDITNQPRDGTPQNFPPSGEKISQLIFYRRKEWNWFWTVHQFLHHLSYFSNVIKLRFRQLLRRQIYILLTDSPDFLWAKWTQSSWFNLCFGPINRKLFWNKEKSKSNHHFCRPFIKSSGVRVFLFEKKVLKCLLMSLFGNQRITFWQ